MKIYYGVLIILAQKWGEKIWAEKWCEGLEIQGIGGFGGKFCANKSAFLKWAEIVKNAQLFAQN